MSRLKQFELTDEAKKLLPKKEGDPVRYIELPTTATDKNFSCRVDQLVDYHAEMLLARKDGLGARWVKKKGTIQKVLPSSTQPKAK